MIQTETSGWGQSLVVSDSSSKASASGGKGAFRRFTKRPSCSKHSSSVRVGAAMDQQVKGLGKRSARKVRVTGTAGSCAARKISSVGPQNSARA